MHVLGVQVGIGVCGAIASIVSLALVLFERHETKNKELLRKYLCIAIDFYKA